jgi:hypothetical protein
MNRKLIESYKHNARISWKRMSFWKKLKYWKLSYKEFENDYVKGNLSVMAWKYGNID